LNIRVIAAAANTSTAGQPGLEKPNALATAIEDTPISWNLRISFHVKQTKRVIIFLFHYSQSRYKINSKMGNI
jgi:hypothetical protein